MMYDPARDTFAPSDEVEPSDGLDEAGAATPQAATCHHQAARSDHHAEQGQDVNRVETDPQMATSSSAPGTNEQSPRGEVDDPKDEVAEASATPVTVRSSESTKKRPRSPAATERKDKLPSTPPSTRPAGTEMLPKSTDPEDDVVASHATKKRKTSPAAASADPSGSAVALSVTNLPRFARKKPDPNKSDKPTPARSPSAAGRRRDRSRSPLRRRRSRLRSPGPTTSRYDSRERRFEPRRRSRSPPPRRRSPTPPPRSPPRKLKRPGGASRITAAEKELLRKRQEEREQARAREAQAQANDRGTQDVVREHYNAVPERGRDWRKTDSRIRGLRSFNNWVKSTIIQKFSPNEDYLAERTEEARWAEGMDGGGGLDVDGKRGLLVLDIGCGKGGDLGKWQQAPQPVELYVGVDPADVSVEQARDRYRQLRDPGRGWERGGRTGPPSARRPGKFHAEFFVKDAFAEWLGDIPMIREVGIDGSVGPGAGGSSRWGGGGGFDVVSMMFCMHYAFESEAKARGMLRNVAGSLKKGGRFLGVIPNSDVVSEKVVEFHRRKRVTANGPPETPPDGFETGASEKPENSPGSEPALEWGNSIYRVRFPGDTPEDGVFRPPFGWKYSYFMEEAVEGVPEYVVPWEAFRALTEDYNLELQYRRPFTDIWKEEKDDPILGPLSERMGVRERGRGPLLVRDEEMEAAAFYVAFCFYKV